MTGNEMVTLPTGRMVQIALLSAMLVGGLAAIVSLAVRPSGVTAAGVGAASAAAGLVVGTLVVSPWKPRAMVRWPMLLLAGHGVSMLGVLGVGALLYSATRPDPVVFLLASVAPFPIATIGQAKLVVAPALTSRDAESATQAPGSELQ